MKTLIITGANGNLGTAVTQSFLDKDYQVIATVRDENAKADMPRHPRLDVRVVDLANESAAASFVKDVISQYPTIDTALMLVGGFAMGDVAHTTAEDIDRQISLNFKTAYHVVRPLLPQMEAQGRGRIVFIGSRPAIEPSQGKEMIAYGLSKSLLFTLAEYINASLKGKNITATVVAPSTLDTPLNRQSMPGADPGNWVKPAALAEILAFAVSEASDPLRETVLKVYNNA